MNLLKTLSLTLALAVTACGSQGMINMETLNQPLTTGHARIIITRNTDMLYIGAAANVYVNGEEIADLGRGGSVVKDIPSGDNILKVTATATFGKFESTFNAQPSKTYSFEISPRSGAVWESAAWGVLGQAIHAQVSENTGNFELTLKEVK